LTAGVESVTAFEMPSSTPASFERFDITNSCWKHRYHFTHWF
jgi:hypothetical protein